MSWITREYEVGQQIMAPHPQKNEWDLAKITAYSTDTVAHQFAHSPTGIIVKFNDGVEMEIDQSNLNEDGSGL